MRSKTLIIHTILISIMTPAISIKANDKSSNKFIIKKLADGFRFTEGPAADKKGNIYFTDIPKSRIHKYSVDGKLSTFMENTNRANGLFFDKHQNLIACLGGSGRLVSIDKDGKITIFAETYKGKRFNSPNDLWPDPNGGIYFTDPRYGPREKLPQDGEHVYYLSPDKKQIIRVVDDMIRPNGIIGTPDGKTLYITDHGSSKTYVYKINPDGTLKDKKLFVKMGSDGMTLDDCGNVYLTEQAVNIFDPNGKLINKIDLPEKPANVCFGGKNNKILFVTARTSLYSVDMKPQFHSFTVEDIDGNLTPLSKYKGSVLMVVNVASKCGYTKQYTDLQKLYEKYKDKGFIILAFPANNFGRQEPGTNQEIKKFCSTKFNVTFPIFSKISAKGPDIHPLYQYLTRPGQDKNFSEPIAWNFNKFLISKDGKTIARYPSKTNPLDPQVIEDIEKALKKAD